MTLKNPKGSAWLYGIDDSYVAYCRTNAPLPINAPLPMHPAALAYTDYLPPITIDLCTFIEVEL